MNIKDTNLIRAFWAVAQCKSFSGAARMLDSSQPTLTRQIQILEQQTGMHLFERSNKGLKITAEGTRLVETSSMMMQCVNTFNRQVVGQDNEINGVLRISSNELVGFYLLPKVLKALKVKYPSIEIEMDINNSIVSLSKRDADIAFRMAEPKQRDLVGRRLADLQLGVYGNKELIEKYGAPKSLIDLFTRPVIGFDKELALINAFSDFGVEVTQKDFTIRTDNLLSQVALARAGLGFCILQCRLAENYPELKAVLTEVKIPPLPFWLVCHSDIQYSKKIRAVMSFFGDTFRENPYESQQID
jgi:DNA-binding transcriptional LysR family regulator